MNNVRFLCYHSSWRVIINELNYPYDMALPNNVSSWALSPDPSKCKNLWIQNPENAYKPKQPSIGSVWFHSPSESSTTAVMFAMSATTSSSDTVNIRMRPFVHDYRLLHINTHLFSKNLYRKWTFLEPTFDYKMPSKHCTTDLKKNK